MPLRLIAALAFLLAALCPATAQKQPMTSAGVLQLMEAAGMSLRAGKILNPCGRPTGPKVKFIDLNGDGRDEAVTQDRDPACYGPTPGVQSKLLVQDSSGRWVLIAAALGIIKPLGTRSNGWADFTLEGKGCQPVWRFGGRVYEAKPCAGAAAPAVAAAPAQKPPSAAPSAIPAPIAPDPDDQLSLFPETYGAFAPGGDCTRMPRVTVSATDIRIETDAGAGVFARPDVMPNFNGPEDHSITYSLQGSGKGLIASIERNTLSTSTGEYLGAAEKAVAAVADATPLRRCGKQVAEPEPEPAPQMRATAARDVDALLKDGYVEDPGFDAAYRRALGPLTGEDWLTSFEGPGRQPERDARRRALPARRGVQAA